VPNPLRSATRIPFALSAPASVRLTVFDVAGRRVRAILDGVPYPAGDHTAGWDGRDEAGGLAPQGIYFLRLEAGEDVGRRHPAHGGGPLTGGMPATGTDAAA
jgi:hypothetical protein